MGHRRFLPQDHGFRQNRNNFDGKIEIRSPPVTLSDSTIIHQLEQVNVSFGKKRGLVAVGGKRYRSHVGRSSSQAVEEKKYTLWVALLGIYYITT